MIHLNFSPFIRKIQHLYKNKHGNSKPCIRWDSFKFIKFFKNKRELVNLHGKEIMGIFLSLSHCKKFYRRYEDTFWLAKHIQMIFIRADEQISRVLNCFFFCWFLWQVKKGQNVQTTPQKHECEPFQHE